MKLQYRLWLQAVFCIAIISFVPKQASSQTQVPRFIQIGVNTNGFYECLPANYDSTGAHKYPLMVFLHGTGELGNGGSDLPTVLRNGPPALVNAKKFPASFTVNGQTFSFIIISPQFVYWPNAADVDAVIDYALKTYQVDTTRVYLTGLSMGGGGVWVDAGNSPANAKRLAAILPICGAAGLDATMAQNIASANLPVWATHNQDDPTVPSGTTVQNVTFINNSNPPPSPLAKMTIFPVSGHDAWSHTYNPTFTENGLNVYQWMLQFQRSAIVQAPPINLPVVLSVYKAYQEGETGITVTWTTTSEVNNKYFILEKSANGTSFAPVDTVPAANITTGHQYAYLDRTPFPGDNFYRLSQVDLNGRTTVFNVLKVNISTKAQAILRLTPNPASTSINVDLVNQDQGAIQVLLSDVQGRIIKTWKLQKQGSLLRQTLDISGIPAGTYVLHLEGAKTKEVQQFIKQ